MCSFLINGGRKVGLVLQGDFDRVIRSQLTCFLFVLRVLLLSFLVRKRRGELQGIVICRGVPSLSPIFFINDCFLFHC